MKTRVHHQVPSLHHMDRWGACAGAVACGAQLHAAQQLDVWAALAMVNRVHWLPRAAAGELMLCQACMPAMWRGCIVAMKRHRLLQPTKVEQGENRMGMGLQVRCTCSCYCLHRPLQLAESTDVGRLTGAAHEP
jgi:hypothetical protein